MSQRLLIDARHPEETRVAVVNGNRIEEFDFEAAERQQLKGNIYLAKVTRVEPSLQAAFVEYGGNRHGFMAFSEIHPDYYQIPFEDREALKREEQALADEAHDDDHDDVPHPPRGDDVAEGESSAAEEVAETGGQDDNSDALRRKRQALRRRYKIQEVIRRRQVLLIQVVKEERGNKGAALTTYLSLAGRYCVLMPNTAHGGGVSRKIANPADRKRLKSMMADLKLPNGMGLILRTAGLKRAATDIKRDFDYLTRLWDEIRATTLKSVAPCLIHEDSGLIKRAIRDIYSRDIEQVLVDGEAGFEAAHGFMKLLMPNHAPKVVRYDDPVPLYQRFGIEGQLAAMFEPVVQLRSGGYLVINPTEALVSIDINSGRSTREHGIEETALKTNLEAAEEIGRQLRLRDMAGLVVIDFIDMEVGGNNRRVEKAMKDALRHDRARIQLGRISSFGLMEMSRQRLRTGVLEASTHSCPMCDGVGYVRSVGSAALAALRALEAEVVKGRASEFRLCANDQVAVYLLNRKRDAILELEERYGVAIEAVPDENMIGPDFEIQAAGPPPARPIVMAALPPVVAIVDDEEASANSDGDEAEERPRSRRREADATETERGGRRRRRRRGGGRDEPSVDETSGEAVPATGDEATETVEGMEPADDPAEPLAADPALSDASRKRRRGRRGGRRREGGAATPLAADATGLAEAPALDEAADNVAAAGPAAPELALPEPAAVMAAPDEAALAPVTDEPPAKPKRASRAKKPAVETPPEPLATEAEPAAKPARKRAAPRRKAAADTASEAPVDAAPIALEATPDPVEAPLNTAAAGEVEAAGETPPEPTAANDAGPAAPAAAAPARKGWWQRTFGN